MVVEKGEERERMQNMIMQTKCFILEKRL